MADKLKTDIRSFAPKQRQKPVLESGVGEPVVPPAKAKTGKVGRPPKPKAQKRNRRITLSLTETEYAALAAKAGLVPEATYVLNVLAQSGLFDQEQGGE